MTPRTAERDLGRARKLFDHDLTCQALGIRLGSVSPGRATVRMRVTDAMVNGHGIAHGGYLFLLADAAFAFAVTEAFPGGGDCSPTMTQILSQ